MTVLIFKNTDKIPMQKAVRLSLLKFYDIIGLDKISQIMDCRSYGDAVGRMCALYPDSAGKLYNKNSAFSKRLVANVLEALVQWHKGRSTWPAV